jgi:hypothetical protein
MRRPTDLTHQPIVSVPQGERVLGIAGAARPVRPTAVFDLHQFDRCDVLRALVDGRASPLRRIAC